MESEYTAFLAWGRQMPLMGQAGLRSVADSLRYLEQATSRWSEDGLHRHAWRMTAIPVLSRST
jgi:hypothetical protein